jgi:hypothetical protein
MKDLLTVEQSGGRVQDWRRVVRGGSLMLLIDGATTSVYCQAPEDAINWKCR